jgi:hypothetical protein
MGEIMLSICMRRKTRFSSAIQGQEESSVTSKMSSRCMIRESQKKVKKSEIIVTENYRHKETIAFAFGVLYKDAL